MMGAMLVSLGLACPGFALLCLGMRRHERQILRRRSVPDRGRLGLRLGGWLLLAASLAPALSAPNPGTGVVAWFGILTLSATWLTIGLNYAPSLVVLAVPGATLVAVASWLLVLATLQ